MPSDALVFLSGDRPSTLGPHTLLVAMDETGHEQFADPNYPIFGLGGCAVMVRSYHDLVREPWALMKDQHFGGHQKPLHASEIGMAGSEQKEAIGAFFRGRPFARFAVIATPQTVLEKPWDPYRAVALVVTKQLAVLVGLTDCIKVALLVEDSARTRGLTIDVFSGFGMRIAETGKQVDLPIERFFGSKTLCEPALEVADFVVQAAGSAVRAKARGQVPLNRKDFAAVFGSVPHRMAPFLHLMGMRRGPRSDAA